MKKFSILLSIISGFYFCSSQSAYAQMSFIDLGLSVKWATCNLGASSPEGKGTCYAWGETSAKIDYSWKTYSFRTYGDSDDNVKLSRYNTEAVHGTVDGMTSLKSDDDIAHMKLGENWRIPTYTEWEELIENCVWESSKLNGKDGYKVTGRNGNSIFLPAAGKRNGTIISDEGLKGYYWSSTIYPGLSQYAISAFLSTDDFRMDLQTRCIGQFVRPVYGPDSGVLNGEDDDIVFGVEITDCAVEEVAEEVVEEEVIPNALVEVKPIFMNGDANAFSKWVNERLVYPEIAKENGIQGRVMISFKIGKDGKVSDVKVLRGVDPSLDKEAVRVVSQSPKWTPGKQRDRAVAVTYTFPVIFSLR